MSTTVIKTNGYERIQSEHLESELFNEPPTMDTELEMEIEIVTSEIPQLEAQSMTGVKIELKGPSASGVELDNIKLKAELDEIKAIFSKTQNLLQARDTVIENLQTDNQNLREQLTIANSQNKQQVEKIDEMKMQLFDFNNTKKIAELNKFAARKLIGLENEYNILKEKNADLIHRNFCLTFEKNELYNLIKILENKIYKSNCDIERLTATQRVDAEVAMRKQSAALSAASSVKYSTGQSQYRINSVDSGRNNNMSKTACYENEQSNLIRQVEFYKNKLFLLEDNIRKKDEEILTLKDKLVTVTNKLETDQLDYQSRYDEVAKYHKNKVNELYDLWKKDYAKLEFEKKTAENDLLEQKEKYSKIENDLLQMQREKRNLDEIKIKYQNLLIKYDAEKIKFSKQQTQANSVQCKEVTSLREQLKEANDSKKSLEDKLKKLQSLLTLETTKNEHLREKCRDYWSLLTAKEEQLKIAQKTVENQVLERHRLMNQMSFYKNICVENKIDVIDFQDFPSHEFSVLTDPSRYSDKTNDVVEQLYRNTTFPTDTSSLSITKKKKTKLSILEKLTNINHDSSLATRLKEDHQHYNSRQSFKSDSVKCVYLAATEMQSSESNSGGDVNNTCSSLVSNVDNTVCDSLRDFTVAKKCSLTKRRHKKP